MNRDTRPVITSFDIALHTMLYVPGCTGAVLPVVIYFLENLP